MTANPIRVMRRCSFIRLLALTVIMFLTGPVASAQGRAEWLKKARWGVMSHYLPDWIDPQRKWTSEEWNKLVEGFDVEGLAKQLESVGASYYLISIGQNSGFYLAPNATYDRL